MKIELPFFRDTPPMSPNLERYGITITHTKGADQNEPINHLSTMYNVVEVVRPTIGKFAKPIMTVYARMTCSEALAMPDEIKLAGETYKLSHFYAIKCKQCGS